MGNQYVDTVPFGFFRKTVFAAVGLYRDDLSRNQDYELNSRIRSAGYKIYLSSRLRIKYYNCATVSDFCAQAVSNGNSAARSWTANRNSFCWRHAVPLLFVTTWLIILPLAIFCCYAAVIAFAYGALYGFAILFAGVQIAFRNNWRFLLLVPFIVILYHVSYGVATALGLLNALLVVWLSILNNCKRQIVNVILI